MNVFGVNVKCHLDSGSLAGYDDYLVVDVIMRGSYTGGIADDEGVAVTNKAYHIEASVDIFKAAFEDFRDGNFGFDFFRDFEIGISLRFQDREKTLVFFVDEVSDFIQHEHVIAFFLGLLSEVDKGFKEFLGIGNIIISGEH